MELVNSADSSKELFSFIFSCWSLIRSSACWVALHSIQLVRQILNLQVNRLPDIEQKPSNEIQSPLVRPSGYADASLTVQYQVGLDIIGVGAAGQVYNVDDYTVLKSCRIYDRPSNNATARALWDYASETIFHVGLLKDERAVSRLLAERPHPNIVEVIDVDQPEGIYIRKYRPYSDSIQACQSDRILWYQDIIRALLHLHTLGITHSDIRKDNILFDSSGHALLSDFSASCPFGYPNPSMPLFSNGPFETVSDATDRFAMGSLIYELETGIRSEISTDSCDGLILPPIQTGNSGLDSLVEHAWRGRFDSTADMLKHAENLSDSQDSRRPIVYSASKAELRGRVSLWRKTRIKEYGNCPFCDMCSRSLSLLLGCVLFSLPTEQQLQILAERYGWRPDDERHFLVDYSVS